MEPVILALKKEYGGKIEFIIVDTNSTESYSLVRAFGIRSIPTFIVFDRYGRPVDSAVGVRTQGQLESMLDEALSR